MSFKVSLVFVIFFYNSMIPSINGQIPIELIPPQLKYVLDPELEKFNASEQLQKECPYYLSGFNEDNQPIWVVELSKWPARDILARGPEWEVDYEKYSKQAVQRIYKSLLLRATPEKPVQAVNVIVDMDNYDIKQFSSIKVIKFSLKFYESLSSATQIGNVMCIVNANFFTEVAINILRPVVGNALERIDIYGTNSNSWIPKLLKLLPRDQLSPKYGGSKTFKPVQVYG